MNEAPRTWQLPPPRWRQPAGWAPPHRSISTTLLLRISAPGTNLFVPIRFGENHNVPWCVPTKTSRRRRFAADRYASRSRTGCPMRRRGRRLDTRICRRSQSSAGGIKMVHGGPYRGGAARPHRRDGPGNVDLVFDTADTSWPLLPHQDDQLSWGRRSARTARFPKFRPSRRGIARHSALTWFGLGGAARHGRRHRRAATPDW